MMGRTFSYTIELEIPASYIGSLLDYVYQKYLLVQQQLFADISKGTIDGQPSLSYVALDQEKKRNAEVSIKGTKPLELKITPVGDKANEETADQIRQDLLIVTEMFEQKVRETTLYFAWREGEEIVPEKVSGKERKSLNRIFLETQVFLFVIFITLGIFLFFLIGIYTPIVLLAFQFIFVFYSPKIIEMTSDWQITRENPKIGRAHV